MLVVGIDRIGVGAAASASRVSRQEIVCGHNLEVMRSMRDAVVDAVVTDPPGALDFMCKSWDSSHGGRDGWIAVHRPIFEECLRILKPGAWGLFWSHPRTQHWTTLALEDAGFYIDTVVLHIFGQGYPMTKNLGRAVDMHRCDLPGRHYESTLPKGAKLQPDDHLCPRHPDGDPFRGLGTALKSAYEGWVLVQKPFDGTYAENVLRWGTGGLNVDACAVPRAAGDETSNHARSEEAAASAGTYGNSRAQETHQTEGQQQGAFPSHLIVSHSDGCRPVGVRKVKANGSIAAGTAAAAASRRTDTATVYGVDDSERGEWCGYGNGDGTETVEDYECEAGCPRAELNLQVGRDVARYFYVPKPLRAEKDAGCEHLPGKGGAETVGREEGSAGVRNARAGAGRTRKHVKNHHITVKSIALMCYHLRLVAHSGQIAIDIFSGSGTTLCAAAIEGIDCIGIEQDPEYAEIARARVAYWRRVAGAVDRSADKALDCGAGSELTVSSVEPNDNSEETIMAELPQEYAEQAGKARTAGGGNYFQHGTYVTMIDNWFFQKIQDACIILEMDVMEAKAKVVYEGPKEVKQDPNAVGSSVSDTANFDGEGKLSAPARSRAPVLGLWGYEESKVPDKTIADSLRYACSDAQPARGMLVTVDTYPRKKRSKDEWMCLPGYECISPPGQGVNAPHLVAARLAAKAVSIEEAVRVTAEHLAQHRAQVAAGGGAAISTGVAPQIPGSAPALPATAPSIPTPPVDPLAGWTLHPGNVQGEADPWYFQGTETKRKSALLAGK